MRTGRPVNPDTIYRVGIHRNGGHVYATTQPFTIGKDGKKRYRHRHWGTVDEKAGMKFVPGTEYLLASPAERSRLIFPEGWDLSELKKIPGSAGPPFTTARTLTASGGVPGCWGRWPTGSGSGATSTRSSRGTRR